METVYKLVRKVPNTFSDNYTFYSTFACKKYVKEYALNQETKPDIGKLFAFMGPDELSAYVNDPNRGFKLFTGPYDIKYAVLECTTSEIEMVPCGTQFPSIEPDYDIYWQTLDIKQITSNFIETATIGWVLCPSLMPVRVLTMEEYFK